MKTILTLLLCLGAGLSFAQERPAYTIFDAQGRQVDYGRMIHELGRQDVVFIGEVHNCPIAHWMEYEIVKDLYGQHGEDLMIGAEMFERDDQLVLNEYLNGVISAERFNKETKIWPNY